LSLPLVPKEELFINITIIIMGVLGGVNFSNFVNNFERKDWVNFCHC